VVKSLGLSIVTVILISSLRPLKKVLTLNSSLSPWIRLDRISNWVWKSSTVEVCFSLVKIPMGSSKAEGANLVFRALTKSSQPPAYPESINQLYHMKAFPFMWKAAKDTFVVPEYGCSCRTVEL
jgi:hypothetical protein